MHIIHQFRLFEKIIGEKNENRKEKQHLYCKVLFIVNKFSDS